MTETIFSVIVRLSSFRIGAGRTVKEAMVQTISFARVQAGMQRSRAGKMPQERATTNKKSRGRRISSTLQKAFRCLYFFSMSFSVTALAASASGMLCSSA